MADDGEVLEYEALVADFEDALLTKLRGHGSSGGEFLRLWVPDTDPVKSIGNMAEAAQLSGQEGIRLRVRKSTLDEAGLERLRSELTGIGELEATNELEAWLLIVNYS